MRIHALTRDECIHHHITIYLREETKPMAWREAFVAPSIKGVLPLEMPWKNLIDIY